MPRTDRELALRRALPILLLALPLVAIAAFAAVRPRVENPHGSFKEECAMCHDAKGWKPAKVSSRFDHAKYGFRLDGAHGAADCMSCHQSLEFKQPKYLCVSCHEDPHRSEMGTDCARCHSARSFVDRAPMVRAHQLTRFPLTGSHAALECEGCHRPAAQGQLQFVGTRAECQSCHQKDYDATTAPDHRAGGFPTDCERCHRTVTWHSAQFDHANTSFPLTGAHRSATCNQCHGDGVYAGKPAACITCHQTHYNATTNPAHGPAGFPTTCQSCHTTAAWVPGTFDHNATAFPLTGAHRSTACNQCHGDGVYAGKSIACVACHQTDYNATTDPGHVAAAIPTTCQNCHGTTAWQPATFDHNATAFPLTGAHVGATCNQCHGDGVYTGKSTACVSCHQTDYNTATNPNHASAGFSTACQTCHNTAAWQPSTFDHDSQWFPIYSGTHAGRWSQCSQCHTAPADFTVFTCLSCHPHDNRTETDGHHIGMSGYSYDSDACYRCHPRGRH